MIVAEAATFLALSASPARLELAPGRPRVIHLSAPGRSIGAQLSVAGLALDPRGRSRAVPPAGGTEWLRVAPARVTVGRAGANVRVVARVPPGARPGDHPAVVLVTAMSPGASGVLVRARLGVIAVVRVPGRLVHRLDVRSVRVRPAGQARVFQLVVANRGNVIEQLRASVVLVRRGRVVGTLLAARRELLPHGRGLIELRYRGRLRGPVTARVALRPGTRVARFPLRL